MKPIKYIAIALALFVTSYAQAQIFDKLGKKATDALERTVERRVERETEKSTDRVLDTLVNTTKQSKKEQRRERRKAKKNGGYIIGGDGSDPSSGNQNQPSHSVSANYDFEPGNVVIFEDTFNRDNVGDFPAKWDTNGSGEIVTVNGEKWFRLANQSVFVPMAGQLLPENFTIEFDLLTTGIDNNTSSQAMVTLCLSDNNRYEKGRNWSMVELSPCQFIKSPGAIEKVMNGQRQLRNEIDKDYRTAIKGKSRISIAVNKTRMRVWLNGNKIVDAPRLVADGVTTFKIETRGLRDERKFDEIHIDNFRMAKTGEDNRSKLITEGKISTNAILFNSGSATIKSGSEAILREVGEAMNSMPDMRIMIVGHTDADGDAGSNLKLSENRAKAVREVLVKFYNISIGRIQVQGKGETTPVADNNSESGKAQNRRVEFIKI